MESDRLLEGSDDLNRIETGKTDESGDTVVAAATPYGQAYIVLLVLFCEPITAFMPMPFFVQVYFPLLPISKREY